MVKLNVYVTKFALCEGIFCVRATRGMLDHDMLYDDKANVFRLNVDAFKSKIEAEKEARDMAKKRLRAIKGEIPDLEKLVKEPRWYNDDGDKQG